MPFKLFSGPFLLVLLIMGCGGSGRAKIDPESAAILAKLESSGDLIRANRVKKALPADPFDPAWNDAKEVKIPLVPQVSVVPRAANQRREIAVRVLYSKKEIAVHLSWNDPTKDDREGGSELFRDAVAVGFPMNNGSPAALPYIGMGNKGRPMNIWHWKASWEADLEKGYQGVDQQFPASVRDQEKIRHLTGEEAGSPLSAHTRVSPVENLLAEGFGTLTSSPSEGLTGKGIWKEGRWSVVVKRPRSPQGTAADLNSKTGGLIPMTFAIWDGGGRERNGMKGLARWRFLYLDGEAPSVDSLKSLTVGPIAGADANRGKELVSDMGCISCHNLPGKAAVNDVGPDLTVAGAMHRPEYLLESMKDPNVIIVPGNGYYDPKTWTSTMPTFGPEVPEKDYLDIAEYLRTLQ